MLVWWATEVECASAIARLERDSVLDEMAVREAFRRLTQLATGWHEVTRATEFVKRPFDSCVHIPSVPRTRSS